MTEDAADVSETDAIWRFERLAAFEAPPPSISEATRTGLRGLLDRFRDEAKLGAEDPESEALELLAAERLSSLVPAPPSERLQEALETAVAPWPETTRDSAIRFVIHGQPELGAQTASGFARARDWRLLAPAPVTELLDGEPSSLVDRLPRPDEPIVIDRLERWFLRAPRALAAMRELLGALALRRAPTLVTCGSWAYRWLRGALYADTVLFEPLTLAALDADGLALWLGAGQGLGSGQGGTLIVRERGGDLILPRAADDEDRQGTRRSEFLRHLAAEARGDPHVAARLWGRALRHPVPGAAHPADAQSDELATVAWREMSRPSLGRMARPDEIAVLHSLALHGALPIEVLERSLPFAPATIARALAAARATQLLELTEAGEWQIETAGYPAVRRELIAAGHPEDGL